MREVMLKMLMYPEVWLVQIIHFLFFVIILVIVSVLCFILFCCFVNADYFLLDAAFSCATAVVQYVQGTPSQKHKVKSNQSIDIQFTV